MHYTTIKISPKQRPNGLLWYVSSHSVVGHVTDAEVVASAKERIKTDRLLGRLHLLTNIEQGDYLIERT